MAQAYELESRVGLGERLTGPAAELCWRTARVLRSTA